MANARALADTLSKRGIRIVSGGTDTHLLLLDLSVQDVTGKEVEAALGEAGITVNKNTRSRGDAISVYHFRRQNRYSGDDNARYERGRDEYRRKLDRGCYFDLSSENLREIHKIPGAGTL